MFTLQSCCSWNSLRGVLETNKITRRNKRPTRRVGVTCIITQSSQYPPHLCYCSYRLFAIKIFAQTSISPRLYCSLSGVQMGMPLFGVSEKHHSKIYLWDFILVCFTLLSYIFFSHLDLELQRHLNIMIRNVHLHTADWGVCSVNGKRSVGRLKRACVDRMWFAKLHFDSTFVSRAIYKSNICKF